MRKILMLPTPEQAAKDTTNSIHQIVLKLRDHLPAFGYELTENHAEADLIVGQAGQTYSNIQPDVAMIHGFYPTAYPNLVEPWHNSANQGVVNNVMGARVVTCPSEWVADILRRDLHINPHVIPWAIDFEEWQGGQNKGYVLWNKTRADGVCDPQPAIELAKLATETHFLSTYGTNPTPNMRVVGRQPFENMRQIIKDASVYLATTKETFGIGTLEAMAAGVPVLAYRHGNNPNLIKHGVTGYIVEPGDIEGLKQGLLYCLQYREILGANAREFASIFTWDNVSQVLAGVYDGLFETQTQPKVSIVIPYFNYARFVENAIVSVLSQESTFEREVIIVNDGSTPEESRTLAQIAVKYPEIILIEQSNAGVAAARNTGINRAKGEYIVCLDADDQLGDPHFLQILADALDNDRSLGIAFTGLKVMNEAGELSSNQNPWPNGYEFEAQVNGRNQVPTCCMFRREAWRRAGGFKAQYSPAEDAELWLRVGALGYRSRQITDAPWFLYRLHDNSLSAPTRGGKRPEPDWRSDKPWVNDKHYPLAAGGVARPVRNYDRPKVAVIIPVSDYHIPYLSQALDSVEQQTERYWEALVINDTGQKLPGMAPFPFARVIDTPGHVGAGYARNLGVKHATAPFVTFLDADDILLSTFLEKTLRMYQRTGRYIYTDWLSLNKEGQIEPHETPEFVMGDVFMKPIQHSINVLLKKEWVQQAGGFDEQMTTWEDVDFFMRLGAAGICGQRVPEPLFIYRYLTGQRRENGELIKGEIIALLRKRYSEYIEGNKMCSCNNPPPGKMVALKADGSAASSPQDMVRIIYNVPMQGQHTVASPSNPKKSYGYRKGGDVFYVFAVDVQLQPQTFTPIADVLSDNVPTPIPPAPQPIQREMA